MRQPREKTFRIGIEPTEVIRQLRKLADDIEKQQAIVTQVTGNNRRKPDDFELYTLVIKYARKR